MISLNAGGRILILFQLNVPSFADSHGRSPYPLGKVYVLGVGKLGKGKQEEWWEERTVDGM